MMVAKLELYPQVKALSMILAGLAIIVWAALWWFISLHRARRHFVWLAKRLERAREHRHFVWLAKRLDRARYVEEPAPYHTLHTFNPEDFPRLPDGSNIRIFKVDLWRPRRWYAWWLGLKSVLGSTVRGVLVVIAFFGFPVGVSYLFEWWGFSSHVSYVLALIVWAFVLLWLLWELKIKPERDFRRRR